MCAGQLRNATFKKTQSRVFPKINKTAYLQANYLGKRALLRILRFPTAATDDFIFEILWHFLDPPFLHFLTPFFGFFFDMFKYFAKIMSVLQPILFIIECLSKNWKKRLFLSQLPGKKGTFIDLGISNGPPLRFWFLSFLTFFGPPIFWINFGIFDFLDVLKPILFIIKCLSEK